MEEERYFTFNREELDARFALDFATSEIPKTHVRLADARTVTQDVERQMEQQQAEYIRRKEAGIDTQGIIEREIEALQAELDNCKTREKGIEKTLEILKRKKAEAENDLNKVAGRTDTAEARNLDILGNHDFDRVLGDDEQQCLKAVHNIRDLMEEGKLAEARAAEAALSAWLHDNQAELPGPSWLGGKEYAVNSALFVRPFSICSDEQLEATIRYAKEHLGNFFSPLEQYVPDNVHPENVNPRILSEIVEFVYVLNKTKGALAALRDRDDAPVNPFHALIFSEEVQRTMWDTIVPFLRKYQEQKVQINEQQLELPSTKTAPIARFNAEAHYRFKSPAAMASTPPLTAALVRCELREIRAYDLDSHGNICAPRPFVYETCFNACGGSFSMDVDGNMMVMCDDTNLCSASVPCYADLATANWQDGIPGLETMTNQESSGFAGCMANASRGLVWVSSRSGIVRGFSATDLTRQKRQVAQLTFSKVEKEKSCGRMGGGGFALCRVGDYLVGSSSKAQKISLWNIQQAIETYQDSSGAFGGSVPHCIQVEEDGTTFQCGDISWIGGPNLLLGAARRASRPGLSVRQVDIEQGRVVGLYCGMNGGISLEKQHCVERFNSIFVADRKASYVYDTRTFQPCLALKTRHNNGQVLGVPSEAAMTAFAFCSDQQEEIQCWDLRMPASHAYSMWTGNNNITSLCWHESSASLLAATSSPHASLWRRDGAYRYGESVDLSDDNDDDYWPKQAVHDPAYFGDRKVCYHFEQPSIIQYSFANGKPMMASPEVSAGLKLP